ncbi:DNA polymerase epsilon catalytic subunit A-like [Cucurbita moschata]|uniref:DNA polymerase epsilon catalytic subunit A-like n=1 Tax=Cucurbita moschata TaxID=3662 RepID=A0A6J1FX14_CUCMO|nr:DNA polymerase epsilon catalytic subunit A-like [Cucurbita moschata]
MSGESRGRGRADKSSRSKKQRIIRSPGEEIESKLGFDIFSEGDKRLGWLFTFAPVLGWQQTAAKIGTQRGVASTQWLNERISLARYARTIRKF